MTLDMHELIETYFFPPHNYFNVSYSKPISLNKFKYASAFFSKANG